MNLKAPDRQLGVTFAQEWQIQVYRASLNQLSHTNEEYLNMLLAMQSHIIQVQNSIDHRATESFDGSSTRLEA